ncbi:MAG: hypothetical protein H3C48_06045 [Chitinophagaceae bacterium]|nr:hypothetical protein [Chitinophagaceae bacterium]
MRWNLKSLSAGAESRRQSSAPRNTNRIRHNRLDKVAKQAKAKDYTEGRDVNAAERWDES